MKNDFPILTAQIADLEAIMQVFYQCTTALIKAGIDQWDYQYPRREEVLRDIEREEVFVWKTGESILATITLNSQQDEQYKAVKWHFAAHPVLVIHRLAVAPDGQGQGIGRALCIFAENQAIANGFKVIRLDAYSGNPISNSLYEGLGYHKAEGLCWFHDNKLPFWCWEKEMLTFNI